MSALITRERATRNIAQSTFTALEEQVVDTMIAACSTAAETYCQRRFQAQQYDELYNGHMQHRLMLRNYPVRSIDRITYAPTPVLKVRNTDNATNQRARVQVTDTGARLLRIASGVTASTDLTFATNLTLTTLATAIGALGNGWSSSVLSPTYNLYPSEELRVYQGNFDALGGDAQLKLHTAELNDFEVDERRGWLLRSRSMEGYPYPPGSPTGITWFGGWNYWRVVYTAGYDAIPDDVQEAIAQWVAAWFWQAKRDPGLQHDYLTGVYARVPLQLGLGGGDLTGQSRMAEGIRLLLAPYKTRKFLSLGG